MEEKETNLDKQELLKAATDIIDQALASLDEQERLEKGMNDDPEGEGQEVIDPMAEGGASEEAPELEKEEPEAEPEAEHEESDEDGDEKDEESDEDVMKAHAKYEEKMKKRGLAKSEAAPAPVLEKTEPKKDATEELRKSFEGQFGALTKTIEQLSARVEKIASQPVGRKGHTGLQPLEKSEKAPAAPQQLRKSEVVNKLIELQKSGNPEVTPLLVSKVETGSLDQNDIAKIRRLVG